MAVSERVVIPVGASDDRLSEVGSELDTSLTVEMGAVDVNESEVVGARVSSVRVAVSDAKSDELTGSVDKASEDSGAEVVSVAVDAASSLIGTASKVVDSSVPVDVASGPVTIVVVVVSREVTGSAGSGTVAMAVAVMSSSVAVESGAVDVESVGTIRFVGASVSSEDPAGPTMTVCVVVTAR